MAEYCVYTQHSFPLTVSCPRNPFGIGHCAIRCAHDSECKGMRKCCTTACGGTQCVRGKRRKQNPDCAVRMLSFMAMHSWKSWKSVNIYNYYLFNGRASMYIFLYITHYLGCDLSSCGLPQCNNSQRRVLCCVPRRAHSTSKMCCTFNNVLKQAETYHYVHKK